MRQSYKPKYVNVFYYPFRDGELRVIRATQPVQVYQVQSVQNHQRLCQMLAYQGKGYYFKQFKGV